MTDNRPPIVVGVDGSLGSRSALQWAAGQAALRGSPLHVVYVAHYPVGFGPTLYPGMNLEMVAAQAEDFAREIVADTLGSVRRPDLRVQGAVGSAGDVLLHRAKGAELLVIGARRPGGLPGLVLGSVSHHCVHHAPCPVVVVPERSGCEETSGAAENHHGGRLRSKA